MYVRPYTIAKTSLVYYVFRVNCEYSTSLHTVHYSLECIHT